MSEMNALTPEERKAAKEVVGRLRKALSTPIEEMGPEGLILAAQSVLLLRGIEGDPFRDVAEFHEKMESGYSGPPRGLDKESAKHRRDIQEEEHVEYLKASRAGHRNKEFDGLLDVIYVALGTIYLHGWDFHEGWRRVHAANMAKRLGAPGEPDHDEDKPKYGPEIRDIVKPEGWKPADLSDLVTI